MKHNPVKKALGKVKGEYKIGDTSKKENHSLYNKMSKYYGKGGPGEIKIR